MTPFHLYSREMIQTRSRMLRLTVAPLRRYVSAAILLFAIGCKDDTEANPAAPGTPGAVAVRLTLDWKPEPEFGGFYAANQGGEFAKRGLDVDLRSAGPGAPTWQLVAQGKTDFATTAADQI